MSHPLVSVAAPPPEVGVVKAILRSAENGKVKVKYTEYSTGTHMSHGIIQYYIPDLTAAEAGTRLSDPGGMQG